MLVEQRRRRGLQNSSLSYPLSHNLSYEGPKLKQWNALVQWHLHLFPPTQGYYVFRDYQGNRRFVKAAKTLKSNIPRHNPRKHHFAPDVSVTMNPRFDDPTNSYAWNKDYPRIVAINKHWQQQRIDEQEQVLALGCVVHRNAGIPACCSYRLDRSLQIVEDRLAEEDFASICG
jgi:hypothetical protein